MPCGLWSCFSSLRLFIYFTPYQFLEHFDLFPITGFEENIKKNWQKRAINGYSMSLWKVILKILNNIKNIHLWYNENPPNGFPLTPDNFISEFPQLETFPFLFFKFKIELRLTVSSYSKQIKSKGWVVENLWEEVLHGNVIPGFRYSHEPSNLSVKLLGNMFLEILNFKTMSLSLVIRV